MPEKNEIRINSAVFIKSSTEVAKCPPPDRPEYAFIGRSNVGKSSLINMLTGNSSLAKTSSKPGKTRLINHFLIDQQWYMVDLPGYGYARVAKSVKEKFQIYITDYIQKRENLYCLFVLLDCRHEAQKIDLEFLDWLGTNGVPFVLIFTKIDKIGRNKQLLNRRAYEKKLLETWEELPPILTSSSEKNIGREEILSYIRAIHKKEDE